MRIRLIRCAVVIVGLAIWFFTQSLIGAKTLPPGDAAAASSLLSQGDGIFAATDGAHGFLLQNPSAADALLIISSLGIDVLGVFLILRTIFGVSIRPFLGLIVLFSLRQICQGLSPLPPPDGMIWHDPGFPSLLVTYGVANDFFFSGHTAIATLGAVEVARLGKRWWIAGLFLAVFEVTAVLILRAHYTLDVYTGLVTALFVAGFATRLAPGVDRWIERIGTRPD